MTGNVQDSNIRVELGRMAKAAKLSLEHVTETWSERAAVREYLGGYPRNVAESRGLADTANVLGLAGK